MPQIGRDVEWGGVSPGQSGGIGNPRSDQMVQLAAAGGAASPGVGGMMAGMGAQMLGGMVERGAQARAGEEAAAAKLSEKELDLQYKLKERAGLDALKRIEMQFKQDMKGAGGSTKVGSKVGKKATDAADEVETEEDPEAGYTVEVDGEKLDWEAFAEKFRTHPKAKGLSPEALDKITRLKWTEAGGAKEAMGSTTSALGGLMDSAGSMMSETISGASKIGALKNASTTPFGGIGDMLPSTAQ